MSEVLNSIPPEDLARLGLAIVVLYAVYRVFLVRRKGPKGEPKAALLVPGWHYDADVDSARAEADRVRRFYEANIDELRRQSELRVGEVRGYRDEAIATNAQLLESLSSATRDIALVLRILDELGSGNGGKPQDSDG